MFAGAIDPENVGIMHGFKDSMDESLKEAMEEGYEGPEKEDDDEESESGKMIGRTPRSPEILMNTLRGDMRSMNARRMELADLVGEQAARETPEEVLTLLQAKLGQGIASVPGQPSAGSPVPGGATPPPPPPSGAGAAPLQPGASPMAGLAGLGEQLQAAGVPAPAAPPTGAPAPGAGPTAPGPLNMADGGEVSYERYYAGGGTVEKKNERASDLSISLKPDPEAIKRGMADYSSLYADVLGDPKEQQKLDKALMLAQIAQRGFNFAANVSPTGTPLSGSFAARAAGAFGDVPSILLEGTKNQREREQKLKLAAFEAARQDESESRKLLAQLAIADKKNAGTSRASVDEFTDANGNYVQRTFTYDREGNVKTTFTNAAGEQIPNPGKLYKLGDLDTAGTSAPGLGLSSKSNERAVFLAQNKEAYLDGTLSGPMRSLFRQFIKDELLPRTDAEGNTIYIPTPFARDMIEKDPTLGLEIPGSKPIGIPGATAGEGTGSAGAAAPETAAPEGQTVWDLSRGIGGLGSASASIAAIPIVSEAVGSEDLLAKQYAYRLQMRDFLSGFNDNRAKSFSSTQDLREAIGNAQDPGIFTTKGKLDAALFAIDSAFLKVIEETKAVVNNPTINRTAKENAEEVLIRAIEGRKQLGYEKGIAEQKAMEEAIKEKQDIDPRSELTRLRKKWGNM